MHFSLYKAPPLTPIISSAPPRRLRDPASDPGALRPLWSSGVPAHLPACFDSFRTSWKGGSRSCRESWPQALWELLTMASLAVDSEQEPLLGDRTPGSRWADVGGRLPSLSCAVGTGAFPCIRLSGQNKGCQSGCSRRQVARDCKMRCHFLERASSCGAPLNRRVLVKVLEKCKLLLVLSLRWWCSNQLAHYRTDHCIRFTLF